jgi:hypothetical protein
MSDDLAAVRGCLWGLALAVPMWVALGLGVWWVASR